MNKIEVKMLDPGINPNSIPMTMFLAKLTQRGHKIKNMDDLMELYRTTMGQDSFKSAYDVARLPHGTITRFVPLTFAIVGASIRFRNQIRTHQVGINYVSASLQYSDYSDNDDFCVPYEILVQDRREADAEEWNYQRWTKKYLAMCADAMLVYKDFAKVVGNDAAGYMAPGGLRNILIIQYNVESFKNVIRLRACNRNTLETQYVVLRMWEEALKEWPGADAFFGFDKKSDTCQCGPDCMTGRCREGKFSCGHPIMHTNPTDIIHDNYPLLFDEKFIKAYK